MVTLLYNNVIENCILVGNLDVIIGEYPISDQNVFRIIFRITGGGNFSLRLVKLLRYLLRFLSCENILCQISPAKTLVNFEKFNKKCENNCIYFAFL